MTDLIICHHYTTGTTVEDVPRYGSAHDALAAHPSWRWSRAAEAWLLRSSRGFRPKKARIAEMEKILTGLGHQVTRQIDEDMPPVAEREHHRADDAARRAEHWRERAAAKQRQAESTRQAGDDCFPDNGQPALVGHHTYKRDVRRRNRGYRRLERAQQLQKTSDYLDGRAEAADRHAAARTDPVKVGNRIERLETDCRRRERALALLADQTGPAADELCTELHDLAEEIDHWRTEYQRLQDEGRATVLGPDTVREGDWVKLHFGWTIVRKVNPKSVTVPNPNFPAPPPGQREETTTYRYHQLLGHRPAATPSGADDAGG
ncbi:DUF3560 domain-containing protein [Amycolatopsis sp. NPDC058986]|uniref:DUF3560 domain-containing protein n=1 Tax=unclassified Amycolatopsis TaxID=2618356 RepID=UPI00366C9FB0